jgi:hypothetical protein
VVGADSYSVLTFNTHFAVNVSLSLPNNNIRTIRTQGPQQNPPMKVHLATQPVPRTCSNAEFMNLSF